MYAQHLAAIAAVTVAALVDYISRALVKPSDQRSSLAELMAHPWILEHARWGFVCFVPLLWQGLAGFSIACW
jgi:hypothetical protein